jgi:uncharacterized phage protein (TIGR01671 family)
MREIKYRAFLKWQKCIFPVLDINWQYDRIDVQRCDGTYSAPMDQFELMQFTGLKDSKGVEIYEGDILKCNGGADDFFFVVDFAHGCFIAKVKDHEPDSDYGYPELKAYIGWKFIPEYEVIGNIYSNPELLKGVN